MTEQLNSKLCCLKDLRSFPFNIFFRVTEHTSCMLFVKSSHSPSLLQDGFPGTLVVARKRQTRYWAHASLMQSGWSGLAQAWALYRYTALVGDSPSTAAYCSSLQLTCLAFSLAFFDTIFLFGLVKTCLAYWIPLQCAGLLCHLVVTSIHLCCWQLHP